MRAESTVNPIRREWGKFAWWWLSANQKQALKEERAKGRFGGVRGKPVYWALHDTGAPEVGIRGTHFMAKSKPRIRQLVKEAMQRTVKGRA